MVCATVPVAVQRRKHISRRSIVAEIKCVLGDLDTYLLAVHEQERRIKDVAPTIDDDLTEEERAAIAAAGLAS